MLCDKGGFKLERNTGNLNEIDKSIEKVEKIRNDIEGTDIVLEKLKLLQNNFGYIVSALLRLRKQGKVLGRIVSSSESGSFKGIDHDLFGGWLGRQSFFKIKDPASLKGLNKSCLAAKLLSFPVDDMRFKNDHPTDNTIAECKDLAEKLIIILSEFITSIQDYKDKVKKESEKRKLRNKLCQLLYEIFLDCKISINNYLKVAEELHGAQSRFDGIVNNMADVNKCFEEFFSTKDPQKKECNLKELVEVNKKRSLQELFTPNEVNRHIPVAFIFSNKNSILEWAFYCLYSNPTLKVDDVPKFIDACVKEEKFLPDGWIFSHKLYFLKINGEPLMGATTIRARLTPIVNLLKKEFSGFTDLIVNSRKGFPIILPAGEDHSFGEKSIQLLDKFKLDVNDLIKHCNKVDLRFKGNIQQMAAESSEKKPEATKEANTSEEAGVVSKQPAEIKKGKLTLADKIKGKFKGGKKETSEKAEEAPEQPAEIEKSKLKLADKIKSKFKKYK